MKPERAIAALVASLSAISAIAFASDFPVSRCVNMGNALDAPNEGDWGWRIEDAHFDAVRAAGFDAVRLPVRWSAHTGPAPDHPIDPAFLARVDEAIAAALARDLALVLDVHHFDEIMADPAGETPRLVAIWRQLSAHYADLPATVVFEPLNEPHGELKGEAMRRALTLAYEEIRRHNPDRYVVFGGEEWSTIRKIATNPAIDDPKIVYTFHYYDPFAFTHQNTAFLGDAAPRGRRGWGDGADRRELAQYADYAAQVRETTGRPVFMGEFGVYEKAPRKARLRYLQAVREAFEGAGVGWCVWNFAETFALYDVETGRWDVEQLDALGLGGE
ncbi:MAG: glycoside hydrolase family 5 protein [Parvularculaceae bacterium]